MSMIFPGKLTEMAAFYAERARGGVGLIVTGIYYCIYCLSIIVSIIMMLTRWHST